MKINIQFLKMERSDAIETYVNEQLEAIESYVPHQNEPHFRVWLECLNSQVQPGKDLFRCAIELDGISKKKYFVEKEHGDFYTAFSNAISAMKRILKKEKTAVMARARRPKFKTARVVS